MKISIIGSGYVGLCTGVGLCVTGHEVTCVDRDKDKIESLNRGKPPFYEKGLDEKLTGCINKGMFKSTTELTDAVKNSEITFIAVGTPSRDDGSIDLKYVGGVAEQIGSILKDSDGYHVIVVKSTVIPTTTEDFVIPRLEKASGKKAGVDFGVCMNPEFLKEGSALNDFLYPDRVVIGEYDKRSGDVLGELYKGFNAPVMRVDLRTAEMVKYASNVFLSTKVSLINEIGNLCKLLGIDVNIVAGAVGRDKRIAPEFLKAGVGFGGSCFGKDASALSAKADELGYQPRLINATMDVNRDQPLRIVELLKKKFDVGGKRIAILGLAFKPETDDIRDAPSIRIIDALLRSGCSINAYDPKAMGNMKAVFPDISYCQTAVDAIENSDACLILTEWDEFKSLTDKDFSSMNKKIVIEGRRVLDSNKVSDFEGVCW